MNVSILCVLATVFWSCSSSAVYPYYHHHDHHHHYYDDHKLWGTTPLPYCHHCSPYDVCCLKACIPCYTCKYHHVKCSMCHPWDYSCLSSCKQDYDPIKKD
ncbi:hypothetical protein M514_11229 [Trichuris suis]|nr:hypothetical protein M514_11229 [Trichuris suis]